MNDRIFYIVMVDGNAERSLQCRRLVEEKISRATVTVCTSGREALDVITTDKLLPLLVFFDYLLPDMSIPDFLKELALLCPSVPRVVGAAAGMEAVVAPFLEAGLEGYIIRDEERRYLSLLPIVLKKAINDFCQLEARQVMGNALKESEEKFRKAFMLSPDTAVISTLAEGRFIEVNENMLRDFGFTREQVIGKTSIEIGIIDASSRRMVHRIMSEKGSYDNIQIILKTADGRQRTCLLSGHLITIGGEECVIQTINDITARQKMEEQLLRSRNLETIGILAGGIARDFNQLLTSIMGNISIAKICLDDVEKIHRSLSRAEDIVYDAAELATRLLTFSAGGEPLTIEISLVSLMVKLTHYNSEFPGINIQFDSPVGLASVQGDETQLKNLLHNILTNAVEGIPKDREGKITITAQNVRVPWENDWVLDEGDYVKITVQDNGEGIGEENMEKIFAPYFTTRDSVTRGGVGLGLPICLSIVKKHRGHLEVVSSVGIGTTVMIFLPQFSGSVPLVRDIQHSYLKGTGRILVLDDEQYVGDITDKMLKQMGYVVEIVKEGSEAVALYKKAVAEGKPYSAVILNLSNKRGMGGEETLVGLLEIDPAVKAIASSGYFKDADNRELLESGFCDTMCKPYSISRLSEVLNKVVTLSKNGASAS